MRRALPRSGAGDIWEMLDQSLNGSLALCRDQKRADFIRNIMECSSREALTFDIFNYDLDSPRAVRGRRLERAAYEACVGKSPAEDGLGGIYELFAWR